MGWIPTLVERWAWPLSDGIGEWLPELAFLRLETIGQLDEALAKNASRVREFAFKWLERLRDEEDEDDELSDSMSPRGISVFYLGYLLGAEERSSKRLVGYLEAGHIDVVDNREFLAAKLLAAKLLLVYESVSPPRVTCECDGSSWGLRVSRRW